MDAIRFNQLPVDEKVSQVIYIDVLPISTFSQNAPIEFPVPGSGSQYLSLTETKLYVKSHSSPLPSIPSNPEEPVPNAARVGPMNNFLHSMWWQLDVFWGYRLVSSSGLNYQYKSYIDVLLNNDIRAKQSQSQAQMFYHFLAGRCWPHSCWQYRLHDTPWILSGKSSGRHARTISHQCLPRSVVHVTI